MRKINLISLVGLLIFLQGCIYENSFGPVMDRYAILYDAEQWQQDTGWDLARAENHEIPLWNLPKGEDRARIGSIPIGITVSITSSSEFSYQILHPETAMIGWIDKAFVKRTFSHSNNPIDPFELPPKEQADQRPAQSQQQVSPPSPQPQSIQVVRAP